LTDTEIEEKIASGHSDPWRVKSAGGFSMYPSQPKSPAHRFFAGLAEQTFEGRLGVVDPPLVDYVAELLTRFMHCDAIFKIRDLVGRRLDQVAEMLMEAEARIGNPRREVFRHIGDFTLFWAGVYPEALEKLQHRHQIDHLLSYRAEGKRSYYIASTIHDEGSEQENLVLKRLSHEFELCEFGLREVRREWERRDPDGGQYRALLIN
jgi:hypothetical protein